MLTNVLLGQLRSGATDPVGVKATESPQRQQTTRSFSDHMDDRARRDEAKLASEKERSKQAEKAAEQREADGRSKDVDQKQPNAGKSAAQEAETPRSARDASDGETAAEIGMSETSTEGKISLETELSTSEGEVKSAETGVLDTDSVSDTALPAAVEVAAQETEVPPVGIAQGVDGKPDTAKTAVDPDATARAQKPVGAVGAQGAVAAEQGGENATPLADEVPAAQGDSAEGESANVPRAAQSTASTQVTAGLAAPTGQTSAQSSKTTVQTGTAPAEAVINADDTAQAGALDAELGDKLPEQSAATSAVTRAQDAAIRRSEMRAAAAGSAPVTQTSGPDETTLAEGAAADEAAVDDATETSQPTANAKSASSGEAQAAAAASQSRGTPSTEPGRRAEGRAREARDAQAVVSGNASPANTAPKPTTAAAAQISAVQQAFAAQMLAGDASGAGAGLGGEAQLLSADLTPDLPGLSQLLTEAVAQPGTVHRPETPRLVAVQLAQAFFAKGERNVDVALNPEELGRVKMRVSTSETGITVVIQTERAETGDLMRRHIHELADEFRKMGFENVSFEFNGGGASGGQTSSEGESASGMGTSSNTDELDDLAASELAEKQVQHLRFGNAGVDMRV
ncbi:flagellar hook-length control protein [Roseobacter sp. MED193]|uniref:flagellar hook-length control protein FliK n=1 Tax=Roseobacter sp. MED193 TaxID=314262 RepID=UPI000068D4EA|nr:flagellar hook-length control protein FliK [Roseobacter sp. MED193]EAQ44179.1 flagellar hook-length control protein [Roseobacter sp. MED193]